MVRISKRTREKSIYGRVSEKIVMEVKWVIAIFLSLITAVSILRNHDKVKQFLAIHQWIYIVLFFCFIFLACAFYWCSEEEEKAVAMEGTLESQSLIISNLGSTIFVSGDNNIPITFELGTSGCGFIFNGSRKTPLFVMPAGQYIKVSKDEGELEFSTRLMGKNGLIAEIINNEWKINPARSWDRNYNDNALEVRDENGDVILQLILFEDRIQFQGIFSDEYGSRISVLGAEGADFINIPDPVNSSNYESKIIPIFKYPSSRFLGKLVN